MAAIEGHEPYGRTAYLKLEPQGRTDHETRKKKGGEKRKKHEKKRTQETPGLGGVSDLDEGGKSAATPEVEFQWYFEKAALWDGYWRDPNS